MPYINSKVNVKITKDQEILLKGKLGEAIKLIPGKSEEWLMVGFEQDCDLYFKGSNEEKIAFIEVKVFGTVRKPDIENLTSAICNIYEEVLSIPQAQIYIKYEEVSLWGWNGRNF